MKILGAEYEILYGNEKKYPKLEDKWGYCDTSIKRIVISDMKELTEESDRVEDITEFQKKILRHEIFHAFLFESGLHECSEFAMNEEMVDWLAIQSPKIFKAFKKVECL